jgi:hypothetical protein
MHIWTNLLVREGALLTVLLALGAAPAAFLSERFDAAGRLALAPILGFCVGTCIATTVLQFVPADSTYWALIPLALSSLYVALRRTLPKGASAAWRRRLPLRDLAQLLVVCVAVAGPLTYTLHGRHTAGPAAYTYTDVDNYVAEEDGARYTSILDARNAWDRAQQTGARFADLTRWDWSFLASFNANPNAAPLDANVDGLLGLGATETNSAFLIVLLLAGALGTFATVRYATGSRSWMAPLAGALFGGPLFLELWFDSFQAAIIALSLVMPFAILGSETLRSRSAVNLILFALVLACLLLVYPVLVPILVVTGFLVLAWRGVAILRHENSVRRLIRPAAIGIGTVTALVVVFDNVGFIHVLGYYEKLANNTVPLPRVTWHLPVEVLPGWLLQTREFWYMPSLGVGGSRQIVLAVLLPVIFLAVIVVGVCRHRPARALVALAGVCALVAEYSYSSRDACTYCAERDLLPLAPIGIVLLALGLAALVDGRNRWMRVVGVVVAVVVVIAVGQRTRVELTRFSNSSYFLDSANRSVLSRLPSRAKAIQLEGYGQTLSAQAEQPLVYHLANEHARGRVSIVLASNQNNAISYLDFGVPKPPGPEFHANYDYVLTRFAEIKTSRKVIARSGGIALEQRTQALDVTPYSGLEASLERVDASGAAWVQPGLPLQLYVTGTGSGDVSVLLTFEINERVSLAPQPGVRVGGHGSTLVVCVPTSGSSPIRQASVQLDGQPVAGPPQHGEFPPPLAPQGISLTAMRAVAGGCSG